jgi:hypothetical protein
MPVDRTLAEDLASTLADLYGDAERRIAGGIARQLAAGIQSPDWAERKLAAVRQVETLVQRVLVGLNGPMRAEIEQALILAYVRGGRAALDELAAQNMTQLQRLALGNQVDALARLGDVAAARKTALRDLVDRARVELPGVDVLNRLAFSLVGKIQGTHLRILRWGLDAYREVIARTAAPGVILGTTTRVRAAQVAWEEFLVRGITGFVDKAGRRWELASYVEMATRSTTAQAAVQSHLDRLGQAGHDLVIVSNAPQECHLCRPWEGRILDRRDIRGTRSIEVEHTTEDGRMITVDVKGSVDEAVSAGLMHPNCRHSLSAYLPGVTKPITHTEDPDGDKARQQQRAIERSIRTEKRKLVGVIDPDARAAIAARIRGLQATMRAHLAAHPELFRKPVREQIGAAR